MSHIRFPSVQYKLLYSTIFLAHSKMARKLKCFCVLAFDHPKVFSLYIVMSGTCHLRITNQCRAAQHLHGRIICIGPGVLIKNIIGGYRVWLWHLEIPMISSQVFSMTEEATIPREHQWTAQSSDLGLTYVPSTTLLHRLSSAFSLEYVIHNEPI